MDGRSSVKHVMMGGKKFKEMRGQDIEGSSTYLNFQELLQEEAEETAKWVLKIFKKLGKCMYRTTTGVYSAWYKLMHELQSWRYLERKKEQ